MFNIVSRIGLGLVMVTGVFVGSAAIANAQGFDIQVGPHGVRPIIRDGYDRRPDACRPGDAMAAARDEGFRRPHIVQVTDRRVVVEGMTDDGPDRISFANRPGCPEM